MAYASSSVIRQNRKLLHCTTAVVFAALRKDKTEIGSAKDDTAPLGLSRGRIGTPGFAGINPPPRYQDLLACQTARH